MQETYLFAGLGNPEMRYMHTRHNSGWMALQRFAERRKCKISQGSLIYYSGETTFAGSKAILCFPTTYMNASGEAVRKIAAKYKIPVKNIIILVDEYNFPVGKVHLKPGGGSDGGHNGVASVIEELGTRDFCRLRLGIDRHFDMGGLIDYVLSDFSPEEQDLLDQMLDHAADSLECIMKFGIARAMGIINSGELWQNTTDEKKGGN